MVVMIKSANKHKETGCGGGGGTGEQQNTKEENEASGRDVTTSSSGHIFQRFSGELGGQTQSVAIVFSEAVGLTRIAIVSLKDFIC